MLQYSNSSGDKSSTCCVRYESNTGCRSCGLRLLGQSTHPNLTGNVASPFVRCLSIEAQVAVVAAAPRLTSSHGEAETIPVRGSVLDLTNPVSVHVTRADTTECGRTTSTSTDTGNLWFIAAAKAGAPIWPSEPFFSLAHAEIGKVLPEALTGALSPKAALDAAAQAYLKIAAEKGFVK